MKFSYGLSFSQKFGALLRLEAETGLEETGDGLGFLWGVGVEHGSLKGLMSNAEGPAEVGSKEF